MNRLPSFMRRVMYRLKRDYGSPVDIYHETSDGVDLTTGKRTVQKTKWHVRRGVPLPTAIHRDSVFSAALKSEFQYGQSVQLGDKTLLLDRGDLPKDFVLGTENWFMIIDNRRYEVSRVEEYEYRLAYFVVLKELKGAPLGRIIEIKVSDCIRPHAQIDANYPLSRSISVHDHICVTGVITHER